MFRSNRNNVGATGVPCPFSRDRLEEIYKNGTPIFLIAEQAGVGRGVVRRWMREAAIDFRAVSQIRKLAAFRNRQSVLARIRHAQRIASQMIREGSIERHWLFTRSVCVKRQKGLIKYHAFRRAKQQAEREQSEAIERSLNGDTFK